MDGHQPIYRFQFDQQLPVDDEIDPIATVEADILIDDRQRYLPPEGQLIFRQLVGQTLLIDRLKQARAERAMHFDGKAANLIAEDVGG